MKKTLDGKQAGLQDAKQLVKENQEFKRREDELFRKVSVCSSSNVPNLPRCFSPYSLSSIQYKIEQCLILNSLGCLEIALLSSRR